MTEPPQTRAPPESGRRGDVAVLALAIAMVASVIGVFWLAILEVEIPRVLGVVAGALIGAVAAVVGIKIHNGHASGNGAAAGEQQRPPP